MRSVSFPSSSNIAFNSGATPALLAAIGGGQINPMDESTN